MDDGAAVDGNGSRRYVCIAIHSKEPESGTYIPLSGSSHAASVPDRPRASRLARRRASAVRRLRIDLRAI
jgi:hypothetical protein